MLFCSREQGHPPAFHVLWILIQLERVRACVVDGHPSPLQSKDRRIAFLLGSSPAISMPTCLPDASLAHEKCWVDV